MQIHADFGGVPLATLACLGLGVYDLVPSFRDRCPLCGGAGCAVRHGLYQRRVVGLGGTVVPRLPVPRFRCRRRGPRQPEASTFSVLPPSIVPRRRLSLPLILQIRDLVHQRGSVPRALDGLAETERGDDGALLLEEGAVYRVLALELASGRRFGLTEDPLHTR